MTIQTEEIIFQKKSRQISSAPKTECDIFSYQPDNMEQMPLGNLYIVSELDCVQDCPHLGTLLASLIKREYYLFPQKGALKSFERALSKANNHLKELSKQGNTEWLGKFHFICTALTGGELLLSQAGQAKTLFFRAGHLSNLGKKAVPDPEKPHPAKIFSSVVSGKIENNDRIILATPKIDDLFSVAGLKQIMAGQQNLAGVSDQINKTLREQDKILPLAILLLEIKKDEPLPSPPQNPTSNRKFITPPIDLGEIMKE